jgi:4-hydroxybenzoate polyprenyltransferase
MKKSDLLTIILSSRPISWVNTAFPFGAAHLFLTGRLDAVFLIGVLYFLIPYNLMMYGVNDVYDYESDLRNPRKGGVEGALVPPRLHRKILWSVFWTNLPFLLALLFLSPQLNTQLFLFTIVFMALAYSVPYLRFKERPFIDSITSSYHFVSPMVYAMLIVGWRNEFIPYIIAFAAWGMASHAFGAVQDIIADRKAHIHSIATAWGAAWTARFATFLYLCAVVVLLMQGGVAIVVGLAGLLYVAMTLPYMNLKDRDAEKANGGWRYFLKVNQVTGFVVTCVMLYESMV